ncbi:uncharacterized protein LOC102803161 [Saccoglossus kowalevskii]|uniref:Uncharacterized protein LOC102803161 n=1 Tax=Saccoglossus kowalevskii TaxID=10224 RepID=A0ABM0MMH8_SACKO|nr:PREDICTED: uncharacterized protein LOC102803161 [Saccoglossus kowalevskii]
MVLDFKMDVQAERRPTIINVSAGGNISEEPETKRGCVHSKYCRKTFQPYVISYFALSAYVFIGAFVFQVLEAPYHQRLVDGIDSSRENFFINLRNGCSLNDGNWSVMLEEQVSLFEDELEKAFQQGLRIRKGYKWDYFASCFFCLTVVSTIGYGHMTPVTTAGRLLCTFYAVVGIPLYFLYLAKLGDLIAAPLRNIFKRSRNVLQKTWLRKRLGHSYGFSDRNTEQCLPGNKKVCIQDQVMEDVIQDGLQRTSMDPDLSLLSYKQVVYNNDVGVQDEQHDASIKGISLQECCKVATVSECIDLHIDSGTQHVDGDLYHSALESMENIHKEPSTRVKQATGKRRKCRSSSTGACSRKYCQTSNELYNSESDDKENCTGSGSVDSIVTTKHDKETSNHKDPENANVTNMAPSLQEEQTMNYDSANVVSQKEIQTVKSRCITVKGSEDAPLMFIVVILIAYICAGAAVFSSSEHWTYTDAIYFCTMTFTTIGFGDLVPVYNTDDPVSQQALIAAYIITGMVMMSSCLSLSQERIRGFGRKMFAREDKPATETL